MMERFGPNPKAMHDSIIKILDKEPWPKAKQSRQSFWTADLNCWWLQRAWERKFGSNCDGLRAVENMSKLGGAVVAAFSDVVFKGATPTEEQIWLFWLLLSSLRG